MEMNLPVSAGIVLGIVAAGVVGLMQMDVMATDTVLMMVTPSMVAFAAVVFAIGTKYGEYRVAGQ
jgi:hypothetical protein